MKHNSLFLKQFIKDNEKNLSSSHWAVGISNPNIFLFQIDDGKNQVRIMLTKLEIKQIIEELTNLLKKST